MSVLSAPCRRPRRGTALRTVTVAGLAFVTAGSALTLLASPAHADSYSSQSWDTPGVYTITVPDNATSLAVTLSGGAGAAGQSVNGVSSGGAGGAGAAVNATYPVVSNGAVRPGDQLQVVVGAAGGGAAGGSGAGPGANGGAGGAATYIVALNQPGGVFLTVAGGGGGGGGGGGQFFGLNGGAGGASADGKSGIGFTGGAGRGGAQGTSCDFLTYGESAESAGGGSAAGGGGGAGQGSCGGQGGGSGDHGSLGGGGGGGAGYSSINGTLIGSITGATHTGDGSVTMTFTTVQRYPQLVASAASAPSPATVGKAYSGTLTASGGDLIYQWSASGGELPPGLSLSAFGTITGTPTQAGAFTFVARVMDAEETPQYADVVLTLTVNPPPVITVVLPDLAVSLSHGKLIKGSVQPLRFTVRNVGTIAATTPLLSITLPTGLAPQSASGTGWTCHRSGQSYTCIHAASLASASSSLVTIKVRVTAPVRTSLTTTASVAVAPTDANPANNVLSNTSPVVAK